MNHQHIFPLVERDGYGTAINGNFAQIKIYSTAQDEEIYRAVISAFPGDAAAQRKSFRTPDDAAVWIAATAPEHQGKPRPGSGIVHWEIRHGYSIVVRRKDDWHEKELAPMHRPETGSLNDGEQHRSLEEAIEQGRRQADLMQREDAKRERKNVLISDALYRRTTSAG